MNKHLKIDLNKKTSEFLSIKKDVIKKYLGGRGLGAYLYSKNVKDAKDTDNSFFLVPGLITGTMFPSSSRSEFVSTSPQTGYYMASSFGGYFGTHLKHDGIAALEITGTSKEWTYIVVDKNSVSFESADDLVGLSVQETQTKLREKYKGKEVSIAAIGKAGENLVTFSSMMADKRAAGRAGTGWHFGYKKLKAIVVIKSDKIPAPKDNKTVREIILSLHKQKMQEDKQRSTYCTPEFTEWSNEVQTYPASNYRKNFVSENEIKQLNREEYKKYKVRIEACWSCPLACTRIVSSKDKNEVRGPEYETIWSLGANCDNFDLKTVIECNKLCDDYGMDTISTGGVLGWYKECIDRGLVNDTWNSDRMLELIKEIAEKRGNGKFLAEGVVAAANRFGFGKEFVVHSKALELPAWDPRTAVGMAVNYATAPNGGDHCKGWTVNFDLENRNGQIPIVETAKNTIKQQNGAALIDSLGTCIFADFLYNNNIWSDIVNAYFGWNTDSNELQKAGERIFQLEHKINKKLGHKLKENTLPQRIIDYEVEVNGEKTRLTKELFKKLLSEYNKLRKWKN